MVITQERLEALFAPPWAGRMLAALRRCGKPRSKGTGPANASGSGLGPGRAPNAEDRHGLEELAGADERADDHRGQRDQDAHERPPRRLARDLGGLSAALLRVRVVGDLAADAARGHRVVADALVIVAVLADGRLVGPGPLQVAGDPVDVHATAVAGIRPGGRAHHRPD